MVMKRDPCGSGCAMLGRQSSRLGKCPHEVVGNYPHERPLEKDQIHTWYPLNGVNR